MAPSILHRTVEAEETHWQESIMIANGPTDPATGLPVRPAPVAAPVKAIPAPVINMPTAALNEAQLARIEAALLGTKAAPVITPAPFTLEGVKTAAQTHTEALQGSVFNLRNATDATRSASLAQAQAAQTEAQKFYNSVLNFIETTGPADAIEFCAALGKVDQLVNSLDDLAIL